MPCRHLRFLVVEDHPVQSRLAAALLTSLGAETVHVAADGGAALAVIRDPARPVDIVLSDISMPGMDGVDFVRHLAAASSPLALILNSTLGAAQLGEIARLSLAYQINLLGAIRKPLAAVKLVPLVQRWRAAHTCAVRNAFSFAELARAWERDEFQPFFEPRADLSSTAVVGFHATPHWRHPERGVLGPRAFMDSVDAYGLHDEMVWDVLAAGARECAGWRARGLQLDLSVSLSLSSLAEPGLAARLLKLVDDARLEPAALVLGVAAATVEVQRAGALDQLERLDQAGVRLALEDFGQAALSSGLLNRLPLQQLKISRNLIAGLRADATERAGSVVALDAARQHGLAAVARGIDTLDDWNRLQGWGCDFGQGRLVGPPLPGSEIERWLHTGSRQVRALGAAGRDLDLRLKD
ncbi:EAL domain-containing response regulator [Ramlibacter sp. AW1]|uniref:EAL domain-containing response regulator n=1 Tax=Ramlibacter aurantiacus TaxID=2801330 RepID=A0A936ZSX2_9BURK|nr:EAL domain-containing response regulator [Ramlibacter aurantiacus]MBL0420540.1 EAL domain-containing response regulator [Ramlibacter aurantiacus]